MQNRLFRKSLVIGIIILFVGASIVPIISGDIVKIKGLPPNEENSHIDVNTMDNDLVGWWAFDEGYGGIAYDYSGNENHGIINEATWTFDTPCDAGFALDFDGYYDYVSFSTPLIPTGSKTVLAWIKPHPDSYDWNSHNIIGNGNLEFQEDGFDLMYREYNPPTSTSNIEAVIAKDDSWMIDILSPDYSIDVENWNFVAFTWDGTTSTGSVKLYIDGIVKATDSSSTQNEPIGEFNALIGGRSDWQNSVDRYWFNGFIDEVRIYNRDLDENEIEYLYNNPGNQPPNKPNKPSGQTNGRPGEEYKFTTSTTDPEGFQIYYKWDWDDGSYSEWLGLYDSGATVSAYHSWGEGSYNIRVKAKDDMDSPESDWSDPLTITITKNRDRILNIPFLNFLEKYSNLFPILRHLLRL